MMRLAMLSRTALQLSLAALLAALTLSGPAHADDDGHRFGIAMVLGGGGGGVIHPGPLPGPIVFTDLGVEMLGEIRPWGGFLRVDFLSSGQDGRWSSFAFAGGTEYRLFGDPRHTALFLRGGLNFELLHAQTGGCDVLPFVPNSCNDIGATAPALDVTADMLGVIAGTRVELPIASFYLAFSANFVPSVAVGRSESGAMASHEGSTPSGALELRFDIEAGFRQTKKNDLEQDDPTRVRHRRRNVFEDAAPVRPE